MLSDCLRLIFRLLVMSRVAVFGCLLPISLLSSCGVQCDRVASLGLLRFTSSSSSVKGFAMAGRECLFG